MRMWATADCSLPRRRRHGRGCYPTAADPSSGCLGGLCPAAALARPLPTARRRGHLRLLGAPRLARRSHVPGVSGQTSHPIFSVAAGACLSGGGQPGACRGALGQHCRQHPHRGRAGSRCAPWWGRTAGVVAALLAALNPFAISFAPTVYTDALLVLAGSLALALAARGRAFWAGCWLGVAIMTKQQGLLFAAAGRIPAFWLAWQRRQDTRRAHACTPRRTLCGRPGARSTPDSALGQPALGRRAVAVGSGRRATSVRWPWLRRTIWGERWLGLAGHWPANCRPIGWSGASGSPPLAVRSGWRAGSRGQRWRRCCCCWPGASASCAPSRDERPNLGPLPAAVDRAAEPGGRLGREQFSGEPGPDR